MAFKAMQSCNVLPAPYAHAWGHARLAMSPAHHAKAAPVLSQVRGHATDEPVSQPSTSASSAGAPAATKAAFVNRQHFWVPQEVRDAFMSAWEARAAHMRQQAGFLGFDIQDSSSEDITVESQWASIPEWEAFNLSPEARRHHLPSGIKQYVPEPGAGFPEDFVPFRNLDTIVQARYPKKKKA